jgi:hypothetical protein
MVEFQFTSNQIENLKSWKTNLDTEKVKKWLEDEGSAEIQTSIILNNEKFKNGKNFSSEELDGLFREMRRFVTNRYLSNLLYKVNGHKEFNAKLRSLIHGKEPLVDRVDNFFNLKLNQNKHVGPATLSHFLVASDASKYPLVTRQTKKILEISSEQNQAALSDALERFKIRNKDTYPPKTLEFLGDWIIFESIKNLLNLDNYFQINNLLYVEYEQKNESSEPKIDNETENAVKEIYGDESIPNTVKEQLLKARIGQVKFRRDLEKIETKCRVTGITISEHLMASHIKPWNRSTPQERLDRYNGLLFSPHIHHLFDMGYLGFNQDGDLLISPKLSPSIIESWKIPIHMNVGNFKPKQLQYLQFHKDNIFRSE